MTVTNVNFDPRDCQAMVDRIDALVAQAGGAPAYDADQLFAGNEDVVSLRSTLLFGLRGMAAYAHHARVLGKTDPEVSGWFAKGMQALGEDHSVEEWLGLIMEFGQVNLKCMGLLDAANTGAFGNPAPTPVSTTRVKGPFVVVTGHDLHDLKMLISRTGQGATSHPRRDAAGLRLSRAEQHAPSEGNFGTACRNQQKDSTTSPA